MLSRTENTYRGINPNMRNIKNHIFSPDLIFSDIYFRIFPIQSHKKKNSEIFRKIQKYNPPISMNSLFQAYRYLFWSTDAQLL